MEKSRQTNTRQSNYQDERTSLYKNSVSSSNLKNKSIEEVISTRISDNFENNFPNSIKVYNDLVLPTKEAALKELRTAAETAPTGTDGKIN